MTIQYVRKLSAKVERPREAFGACLASVAAAQLPKEIDADAAKDAASPSHLRVDARK